MSTYAHTLTELDIACGVTLADVARELSRGVFRENGATFIVSVDCAPALASSVARAAFGVADSADIEYVGRTPLGRAYRRAYMFDSDDFPKVVFSSQIDGEESPALAHRPCRRWLMVW